jgi:hypothetical protein
VLSTASAGWRDGTRQIPVVAATVLALLVVAFLFSATVGPRLFGRPRLALVPQVTLIVTTFTVVLLLALAGTYTSLYRDLPNPFTLSLVVFCVALLV